MHSIRQIRDIGQSLWLDNITREMLDDGHLGNLIDNFSITGLTSNPAIFNQAIGGSAAYDGAIRDKATAGMSGEALFMALALEDVRRAAGLFKPIHDATDHLEGWVSMEVSPLLAHDSAATVTAAAAMFAHADRPNVFIKIPGTREGLKAIEASIFAGVPINVTLLFSPEQYLDAADAYMRGLERRLEAGLDLRVASVASVFVSRWDTAVSKHFPGNQDLQVNSAFALRRYRRNLASGVDPMIAAATSVASEDIRPAQAEYPSDLRNRLGIAVAQQTYQAYRRLLASTRWQALASAGAQPQRLLWASTGTKDPRISENWYVEALVAPDTVNTFPEETLRAFASRGHIQGQMAIEGGAAKGVLTRYARAGLDVNALASRLQHEGVRAFEKSWNELLTQIAHKSDVGIH